METNQIEQKKPLHKRKWVWVVGALVVFYIIGSGSSSPTPAINTEDPVADTPVKETATPPEEVVQVTASKIIADYKANEILADSTYKGKLVAVTGTVDSIAKDILDNPFITLTNEAEYSFESVQCIFSKSQEAELANIVKNQSITLQGRVSGKLGNVLVRECSIVK